MTSERKPASGLREIEEHWSIDDLFDAHLALDVHEELHRLAREQAEDEARNR